MHNDWVGKPQQYRHLAAHITVTSWRESRLVCIILQLLDFYAIVLLIIGTCYLHNYNIFLNKKTSQHVTVMPQNDTILVGVVASFGV